MKLASFLKDGRERFGVVANDGIADLTDSLGGDLTAALAKGVDALAVAARNAPVTPLQSAELLPPITNPGKIICIGLNYRTHIEETGRDTPTHPMLFSRYPDSVVGHGQPMLRPRVSTNFDFEGELAVIMGRTARHVKAAQALDYVAGYSCFNDGTIRDYQRRTSQFLAGKTFYRSGAFGPWLVTPDEIGDVSTLKLVTRLNGEVMQEAETSDLLFTIGDMIEYISAIMPLNPGDVIATGTTGGVGAARKPPVWMKQGDLVEVEISRIGILSNPIRDES